MIVKSSNFPYPALYTGSPDYNNAFFNIKQITPIKTEGFEIFVNIEYDLECSGLEKMIKDEKAAVYANVFCSKTSYRKSFIFTGNTLNMSLSKKELSNRVVIRTHIIAIENAPGFSCDELNNEFWNDDVNINKGDKLAIGDEISFSVDSYDPLRPVKSIFQFKEAPDNKRSLFLDWNGNKVIVFLSPELFVKYKEIAKANELRNYIPALIVIPALVETFIYIKQSIDDDTVKNKSWYKSIDRQLRLKKIDILTTNKSYFEIANDILHNGIFTALNCVERAFATYREQEDRR